MQESTNVMWWRRKHFFPLGLLIHFTKSVPGTIHDFKLFKDSGLVALINKENEMCNQTYEENCTTLGDAGYQGLSSVIPGSVTPIKKSQEEGSWMTEKLPKTKTFLKGA